MNVSALKDSRKESSAVVKTIVNRIRYHWWRIFYGPYQPEVRRLAILDRVIAGGAFVGATVLVLGYYAGILP